jgi:zinc transport system ATP-binding protein
VEDTIRVVGLDARLMTTPVGHLSGGQFQRALIAFALLGKPNVLIFDEPTASIDKPGEEQMYELIHRLQEEYGITVILVSHDLSFVYRYATKVLAINKNEICFGSPEDALTPEALQKLYGPTKFYHSTHEHSGKNVEVRM